MERTRTSTRMFFTPPPVELEQPPITIRSTSSICAKGIQRP